MSAIREAIFPKHIRGTPEGTGRDEVSARVEVAVVNVADDIRAYQVQVFVAALVLRPSEILGGEVPRLDHRSHRPVEDEDSPLEGLAKKRGVFGRLHAVILTSPGVPSRVQRDLLLHYAAMAADGPKSAFELAMERLRQKDKEAGVDPLSSPAHHTQKAAIARPARTTRRGWPSG